MHVIVNKVKGHIFERKQEGVVWREEREGGMIGLYYNLKNKRNNTIKIFGAKTIMKHLLHTLKIITNAFR